MELSRKEYPGMLDALQPSQAVAILNERVKRIGRLNHEIAEWIQERRKIEEAYAQSLKKLSRRQPPDESSGLGIFVAPWAKIVNATESMADSHQRFAQRVEVDVEQALKDFISNNRDMQALSTIQGNLASMARDIEGANDKAEKLKRKGSKASAEKVASANSEIESANSQWISQAPYVFEHLQAADETRIHHLRDVLTQYQTHELDQVEQSRTTTEECLNALLNIEAGDEIRSFAGKAPSTRPRPERPRSRTVTSSVGSPPPPPAAPDDRASQWSDLSAVAPQAEPAPEARPAKRSGLRRLGTVFGRRKDTGSSTRGISPEKRFGDKYAPLTSTAPEIPPIPTMGNSNSHLTPTPSNEDTARPYVTASTSAPLNQGPTAPEPPHSIHDDKPIPNVSGATAVNGLSAAEPLPTSEAAPEILQSAITAPSSLDPKGATASPTSVLDAISQAEREAASESMQNNLKLDIRNTPIQEEEDGAAEAAMANVASALRSQAASARRVATPRGRRDVRNTIFVPSPQISDVVPTDSPMIPGPPRTPRASTFPTDDQTTGSDAQSVRSSRSLTSLAGAKSVRHPEMTSPGLNSSVVEAVSATFKHAQVTKVVIMGEMALAYNATDSSTSSGSEHIRLENFPALEKVAPNPTIITPIPDKAGEYSVKLGGISRAAVAFKYQVHVDDTSLAAHAPIIVTPAWKIEPHQSSVILHYSLNPSFTAAKRTKLTLHHVTFIIHLEGSKATGCQSKPVGTFSKEKSLIYWQLGDVTLQAGEAPAKLLARFSTESEAKPGSVEARWEITDDDATGLGSQLHLSQLKASPSDGTATGGTQDDPFADDSGAVGSGTPWKDVPVIRRLVSGKYIAS